MKPHMFLIIFIVLVIGYAVAKHTSLNLPVIG